MTNSRETGTAEDTGEVLRAPPSGRGAAREIERDQAGRTSGSGLGGSVRIALSPFR